MNTYVARFVHSHYGALRKRPYRLRPPKRGEEHHGHCGMVFGIPTETGPDFRVDRIAMGTGKVYNNGNSPVNCSTEAAC